MNDFVLVNESGEISHDFDSGPLLVNGIQVLIQYTLPAYTPNYTETPIVQPYEIQKKGYVYDIMFLWYGLRNGNRFRGIMPMLTVTLDYPDGRWAMHSLTQYTYHRSVGSATVDFHRGYLRFIDQKLVLDLNRLLDEQS